MECRSTIGQYSEKFGTFNLYCSSQGVHNPKKISGVFNIEEEN